MEDGEVDITVIDSSQHKMGKMENLLLFYLLQFFTFNVPQIKSHTMQHVLMSLVNTTLWACTKIQCLHITIPLPYSNI